MKGRDMDMMQEVAFKIIAQVGTAKSMFIEAISYAKEGDFDKAEEMIQEGEKVFSEAHTFHFDIVQKEANNEELRYSVLFMHSEDQLMSTETIRIFAQEIIDLYKKLDTKN